MSEIVDSMDKLAKFRESLGELTTEHGNICVCDVCRSVILSKMEIFQKEACVCQKLLPHIFDMLDHQDRILKLYGIWLLEEYGQQQVVADNLMTLINEDSDLSLLREAYQVLKNGFPAEAAKLETSENAIVRFFIKELSGGV